MSQRILITGGTGYLGSSLSEYLGKQGYQVTVWDCNEPALDSSSWRNLIDDLWISDIRDPNSLTRLKQGGFKTVVHLAGIVFTGESDSSRMLEVNTLAIWDLLQASISGGVERFIHFSSERVLGDLPSVEIDETFSPVPNTPYGLSKLLSEQIVEFLTAKSSLQGINLRLSNAFGRPLFSEGPGWRYAINQFCRDGIEKEKIQLRSDGEGLRDFVHVEDICRATRCLIEAPDPDAIYLVASGSTQSILQIAHLVQCLIRHRYDREVPIVLPDGTASTSAPSETGEKRHRLSIDRISTLGHRNQISLEKGIEDILLFLDQSRSP